MVALQYKLKALRTKLRDWNWNVFGNLNVSIKSAQDQLLEIQNQISSVGFSDELHSAELEAHCHLNSLLLRQESLLKEQSRVRWLTNGDRNTAFYHSIVTRRKPSSGILLRLMECFLLMLLSLNNISCIFILSFFLAMRSMQRRIFL